MRKLSNRYIFKKYFLYYIKYKINKYINKIKYKKSKINLIQSLSTDNSINIVTACDNSYVQHLCVTIASIMAHSDKNDKYEISVLYNDINEKNLKKILKFNHIENCVIRLIKLNKTLFQECPMQPEICYNTSIETYFRFLIPVLFKDKKKVLYLDADIVVNGNIKELYSIPLEDNYAVVVEDTGYKDTIKCMEKLETKRYFNAGVMLLNVPLLVKDDITAKLFKESVKLYEENKLTYQDQCVLNYVLNNKLKFVDIKYNLQASIFANIEDAYNRFGEAKIKELTANPYLIHYLWMKPWYKISKHPLAEYYWKYLKHTPFKRKYYKHQYKKLIHYLTFRKK